MPGLKRTAEDARFSKAIRERDGFTCQRCGKAYASNSRGLHSAHMFSRGIQAVRTDPDNAAALCYGCHRFLDTHPDKKRKFFRQLLGDERFEALELRSNQIVQAPRRTFASEKRCSQCRETKPASEFYRVRRPGRRVQLTAACRVCTLKGQKGRDSHSRALQRYGLSPEDYAELLESQGGVCAICEERQSNKRSSRLYVDHDARTGVVRGLLCSNCNTALGLFKEDLVRMSRAADYLLDAEAEAQEST